MENTEIKKGIKWKRVSSKRQKDEGASLEAQEKLTTEYSHRNQITIVKDFEVDESAKNSNRKVFLEMISFLQKNRDVKYLICEKTDRLLRGNLKDRVLIEELINEYDKEIHCVKEGLILGKNTKSAQKLHFDIQNALARHFLNNLSDEVKKGYDILIENGNYPHIPPLGYESKLKDHVAVIDKERSPFIKRAFELYASGDYSEKQISYLLYGEGFRSRKGNRVGKSSIGKILNDPFYYGSFMWKNKLYQGNHEPIIDKDLFDKVDEVLNPKKKRGYKHDFAFTGIMKCGECGNGITAETQKGHIYYRCTKPKGAKSCNQKYTREEVVLEQLKEVIKQISIDLKKLNVVKDIMKESHSDEEEYLKASLEALNERYTLIKGKLDRLLDAYLDGAIKKEVYEEKSRILNIELEEVNSEIASYKHADKAYFNEIEAFLDFCNEAPALFASSRPALQRELLRFVVSNLVLKDKKLDFSLKMPFSIVAQYSENENWQGW